MHGLTCLSCTLYNSTYLTMPLTVPSRPVMKGEPPDDAQRHRQSRLMQSVEVLLSLGTSNPELWANVRVTMITKLEGWVQEDVDTKGEEIRQEIEAEVEERVEQQTDKVLAKISAFAAEVRQLRRDTQQRLKDQDQLSTEVGRQVLGGVAHIVTTEVTKMSAKRQLDGFELAVGDILDKFAHEMTQDKMFRIFNTLQTKPMSAALYNICGARSQVDLQRGLVEEWKRGS
ncbi:hypothetical protein SMACR_03848 [Sordaria macrospora]|uniref:WGS project CABT00000000 data, contig 2.16 n=2 Tax=Sordaria macrospora TaxID=5147 RepID=F7W043_SORMK|nr:uncharacterized protein SMAC_03848 [Sordaria macrospora k-hell]KAA8636609.1 hypothetical protein SMACR_03848 [Sordaria macrospora]WPJ66501.1 hypothetical protein SMAC4_03848 [Sordaria macrospora]CCC11142.1 unnamed protein product [Sordaria macrospora k-hell]